MVAKRLKANGMLKRLLGLLALLIVILIFTSYGADEYGVNKYGINENGANEIDDFAPRRDDWSWELPCC